MKVRLSGELKGKVPPEDSPSQPCCGEKRPHRHLGIIDGKDTIELQSQPMSEEEIEGIISSVESGLPFITGVLLKEDIRKLILLAREFSSARLALPKVDREKLREVCNNTLKNFPITENMDVLSNRGIDYKNLLRRLVDNLMNITYLEGRG